jgi:hypothetical protein
VLEITYVNAEFQGWLLTSYRKLCWLPTFLIHGMYICRVIMVKSLNSDAILSGLKSQAFHPLSNLRTCCLTSRFLGLLFCKNEDNDLNNFPPPSVVRKFYVRMYACRYVCLHVYVMAWIGNISQRLMCWRLGPQCNV